ncbi:hypothetical protein ABZ770_43230 [Streptomyces sp. NPDC006654]|uniref:hypothetical protein n=1 Tax=Streptomyces sp. NPDC006654 TaxID=3156897 RepID=UPI0033DCB13F
MAQLVLDGFHDLKGLLVQQLRIKHFEEAVLAERQCFTVDPGIPESHRLWIRRAGLLVEGHCITVPYRRFTVALNGSDNSVLRSILSESGCLRIGSDRSAIPVGRCTLNLGLIEAYPLQMTAEKGLAALAARRRTR